MTFAFTINGLKTSL